MKFSGVFRTNKKDGSVYFRASITFKEKHISLGSFSTEEAAGAAYCFARKYLDGEQEYLPHEYEDIILSGIHTNQTAYKSSDISNECEESLKTKNFIGEYLEQDFLSYDKWIMLLNLKKTGIYCKNPIYLYGKYFIYYLDKNTELKFDADQLFFFSNHRLQKRGGHIFYNDYGMQCGLLNRFGVKNFAVLGRDYNFINGDALDFRYGNLEIINKFNGVSQEFVRGRKKFFVKIHFRSDLKVGYFDDEITAAIAYNKAADSLEEAVRRRKYELTKGGKTTNVECKMLSFELKKTTISAKKLNEKRWSTDYKCRKYYYRKWKRNYVENITRKDYIRIYEGVCLAESFTRFLEKM